MVESPLEAAEVAQGGMPGSTRAVPVVAVLGAILLSAVSSRPAASQGARPAFEEVSAAVGLNFVHDNGASGALYLPEIMGPGGALLDYDRDGDLDVYLVQGHRLGPGKSAGAIDRLYRNDALPSDGPPGDRFRFVDVTATSGIVPSDYGIGAATGDFDNDGWMDLYISNLGANQLLRNNGDGTFSDATIQAGVEEDRWSVTATFFDYDRDGWLDLWVVNYLDFQIARRKHCLSPTGAADYCDPNAYEPVTDSLFRNRGDGTFERVSSKAGIDRQAGAGLGVVAADFNNDGWLDVYVTNDGMPNQLYVNGGDGTFREDALFAGCAVSGEGASEASMGAAAADLDNDGDEDLFLTHLTKETNTLYVNDGSGFFKDGTEIAKLGVPSWNFTGFGTGFLDFDADGWLDLLVVNGAVTFFASGNERRLDQPNQLYRNLDGRRFEPAEAETGVFAVEEVSRGALLGDIDGDGDTDAIVLNNAGSARVLLNRRADGREWLGLRVLGKGSRRDLLGARVELRRSSGASLWRRIHSDGSYASAGDPRSVFGLGGSADLQPPQELIVHAPGGRVVRLGEPPAGRYLEVFVSD